MDDNAKAVRREYFKAWRAANKDRVKAYNNAYWKRKAQKMQEIAKPQNEADKEEAQ